MAREPPGAILNPAPGALTNLLRLISNNDAIVGLATWVTHPRLPAQRSYKTRAGLKKRRRTRSPSRSPRSRSAARPTGHHPDMVAQSVALDARDRVTWRAQQEHAFLSDGVDDVANLLVVQQEIDDQVLLLGSLQF